jgi:hypothetical protein
MRKATNLVENILQALLSQCRAFHVLDRAEFPSKALPLLLRDRPLLLPRQLLYHHGIVPQVYLGADDEAGDTRTVMVHFREPLLLDVLKRSRRGHAKAYEEHVRLRVGQWSQAVVILLT